jgi:hypothetical protein
VGGLGEKSELVRSFTAPAYHKNYNKLLVVVNIVDNAKMSNSYAVGGRGSLDLPDAMRTRLNRQFIDGAAQMGEILPSQPVLHFLKIAICSRGNFNAVIL